MPPFTFKELADTEDFDPTSLSTEASFTQAKLYADWQKDHHRVVRRFVVLYADTVIAYFQLIKHHLPFKKSYLYIPYGPITNNTSPEFLSALKSHLVTVAKEEDTVFVRLDFSPTVSDSTLAPFFTKSPRCTYHGSYFQPRIEWFLELSPSEDELLKNMHEKTRYSIRLAERKDVTTEIITKDFDTYFEPFFNLMQNTATRNKFSLHHRHYYQSVFKSLVTTPNSFLSIARLGQTILAIDLIITYGNTAHFVFGATSDEERNRMPAHLAQWGAIKFAKSKGCTYYNFGAVSSEDDSHESWDGLSSFKRKFGGKERRHSDFFDVVVSPICYYIYNLRHYIKNV
jgi:lipid II:glycine glycyltransferase (peptidoglycan interpeptide bridge formation enzyme)